MLWFVIASIYVFRSSTVFVCFSKPFPKGEWTNLACSITFLWSGGSISSPARNSYLSIFPYNKANIFAASLLVSYCSFLFLMLLLIVMVIFYILSERFFLKRKRLCDVRVALITKSEYGIEKVNIWWMIKCNLLKFLFVWNFIMK